MAVSLCIHGHFYQPPRENPCLGSILTEASAAPMRHWNERIVRESYAPLAWARRLSAEGKITDIINCYEWMSFNAGPTLLRWMEQAAPEVLERMREGDANSLARWGHGNALAQVYHHVIMPLASEVDRKLETLWAIDDFRHHFGRDPEGMWLSECAVDLPTLESVAREGVQYVILAPRQAKAVVSGCTTTPVNEGSLPVGEPYTVQLPSGRTITAVFYHGRLSQSIAFEGLLRNGEMFWQRITGEAGALASWAKTPNPLLTIATDGETYGHHFKFGEMALAYVLSQGYLKRDNIGLTNLGGYIEANPPQRSIILHEPSSWSCVHGIERWRSNCGCCDGGHGDWNQEWRGPLRDALDLMRGNVRKHYALASVDCIREPEAALHSYGPVLADKKKSDDFAAAWFKGDLQAHGKAWKLLIMQEQSLAAFASCAWFFDDISRIEPENGLTYALRANDLMVETGGSDCLPGMLAILDKARSNVARLGSGRDIFLSEVLTRRDDHATLCLLAWLLLESRGALPSPGESRTYVWPDVTVELFPETILDADAKEPQHGTAVIRCLHQAEGETVRWRLTPPSRIRKFDAPLVTLAEARVTVTAFGDDGKVTKKNQETTRRVRDLSRPMRDYLLSLILENREHLDRPELSAVAAHTVSLIGPWTEVQYDMPRSDLWVGFIPYLLPECMLNDQISDEQRIQVESLLQRHLSERAKRLAWMLVVEIFLAALVRSDSSQTNSGLSGTENIHSCTWLLEPDPRLSSLAGDDATLAKWAARVTAMMPDMDWWPVQNCVWEQGIAKFPLLAGVLGFR